MRTLTQRRTCVTWKRDLFFLACLCVMGCGQVLPGADFTACKYGLKISFPGYARAEVLTNFPVLVVLGTNIANFTYDKFASSTGGDLRFSDSAGTCELPYEIETWSTNQPETLSAATDIPGCVLWLNAGAGVTSAGGYVSAWADQSGKGNAATQVVAGSQPLLVDNALNGRPVIRFDGSDDSLSTSNLSAQLPTAATLFVVAVIDNDASYELVYTGAYNSEWWRYANDSMSYPAVFRSSRVEQYCVMPMNGVCLFTVSSSASAWQMWLNSENLGIVSGSYSAGGAQTIGAGGTGGPLKGDIAEVIEYNRALTAEERARVNLYLSRKYGVAHEEPACSHVWVQVPALSSNSYIYARWGSENTNPPACTTNGTTWSSSGYLAVWHMQAASGTNAQDSAGSVSNATLYNMADVDWSDGKISGALCFKDSNDRMQFANTPAWTVGAAISLEMWIKPQWKDHPVWGTLYGDWYDANNMSTHLSLSSGRVSLYASSTGANADNLNGATALPLDQWSHVAGTFDAGRFNVYLNGTNDAAEKVSGSVTSLFNASWPKTLGIKNDAANSLAFAGVMDEVRISSVVRSSNWIWACWLNQASNSLFSSYDTVKMVYSPGTVIMVR